MITDSVFQRALTTLLTEILDGPPGHEAFVLNPGDAGLLGQLDTIPAAVASTRPMPGRTTIAAHVEHVLYGLQLLIRWAQGEENPWADADWEASWQRNSLTQEQWDRTRAALREASATWQKAVAARTVWDEISAAGAMASAAHTAYHLGAIRQILAAAEVADGSG